MADTQESAKQKLSHEIEAAKGKLEALKRDVDGIREEDKATLKQRQAEVRARLDEQKAQAKELQGKITSWKDEKKQHTTEAIASWKQQRQLDKLQKRAERAEGYAIDMVTVATADFEEAEAAVFDAIAARVEAEEAGAGA
jgi:chromosome segregation ATPase